MKITIDPTDTDSITQGLNLLAYYKKYELKDILTTFPIRLAEEACAAANSVYEGFAQARYTIKGGGQGFDIIAESGDQIAFIEFGTGVWADPSHELADSSKLGFVVYPGSWSMSEEGSHTWENWHRTHNGNMTNYPYNAEPSPGLLAAYNAILNRLEDIAKEVFLDD